MATHSRQGEQETRNSAQETTRKVADEAVRTSRTAADAAERTMRAGAEAIGQNADRTSGTWRSGNEAANRIFERSCDQIGQIFGLTGDSARQTVRQTSGNMRALVDSTTIIAGGLQDVTAEWMRFAQSRMEQNLDHIDRLLECRSLPQHLAVQTQIVRDNLEAFLHSARLTSQRATQVADQAVRSVGESSIAPE